MSNALLGKPLSQKDKQESVATIHLRERYKLEGSCILSYNHRIPSLEIHLLLVEGFPSAEKQHRCETL